MSQAIKVETSKERLCRISLSLPEKLVNDFDRMVVDRDYDSRSQAFVDMIHKQLNARFEAAGEQVMAGTINVVYDHSVPNLQKHLAELQYTHIDEVISTLNVNLTHDKTMSVVLVQGPANTLRKIANKMISLRGVLTGEMMLSAAILPPVHPLPQEEAVNEA